MCLISLGHSGAFRQPAVGSLVVIKDQTSIDFFSGHPSLSLNSTVQYRLFLILEMCVKKKKET